MFKKIIVLWCVFSLLASSVFASLNFNGTTHLVNHGSGTSLDNLSAFTILMWVQTGLTAGDMSLVNKGTSGIDFSSNPPESGGGMTAEIPRATDFTVVNAASLNFASYGLNKWVFVAVSLNSAGVDGDQILMVGDLNTIATEPSSYITQIVGSGSQNDDSADDITVGRRNDTFRWIGDIASIMIFDTNFSVAEIIAQQFNPMPIQQPVLYGKYGFNGTGSQIDLSGQATANNGTVTGATVADHVPLRPPFAFHDERVFIIHPASGRKRVIIID